MSQVKPLKIINPLFFILVAAQFILLFVSKYVEISWQYQFHEYNGYAIGIVALVHIYFNWTWIKANFFKKKPARDQ